MYIFPLENLIFILLAGPIPPELGKVGALEMLDLWRNQLSGE